MTKLDSHQPPPSNRIVELDGLRGIAILLVLIIHYLGSLLHPEKGTFLAYFSSAISLSWSGVDLFFVLSGFLIAGILLEQREAANYFSVFYVRRICRIFPLYFLLLGVFVAARALLGDDARFAWVFGDPLPTWRYATFTQNILFADQKFQGGWLPVTWSLAVEEQFYLVLPLLIRFLPSRLLAPVLVGLSVMAFVLRIRGPHYIAAVGMPWHVDSLAMGALLACGVRSGNFMIALASKKRWLWGTFGIMLLGTVVLSSSALADWAQRGGAFVHSWLAVFYTLLLALALLERASWLGYLLRFRVLVWFGTVSYGVYLVHPLVLGFVHGLGGNAHPIIRDARDLLLTAAAFAITLLLASLIFFGMERPVIRRGHDFRYRNRSPKIDNSEIGAVATASHS